MPSVSIMDEIDGSGIRILEEEGFTILKREDFFKADAIVVRSATKVDRKFIDRCKNLKIIVRAGVGMDNIDVDYAVSKGISVKNTPMATSVSVAELTVGLILSCLRYIPKAHISTRSGKWEKGTLKGRELYGKTVGIVGLGNIGMEVAKSVECFGAKVVYSDVIDRGMYKRLTLEEVFKVADIISLHLPLTPKTIHIINHDILKLMKENSILINTSRGEIIKQDELVKFLKERKDIVVALDVYEEEPPSGEILELENVVLTPHIGAQTYEAQKRASMEAARIIVDFFK